MAFELLARFLLGGVIVSSFALIGQLLRPKTFAGLFGAAPSVAIASLLLARLKEGSKYAALEAHWMMLGAVALVIYCAICVRLTKRSRPNLWVDTALAWSGWLGPTLAFWWLSHRGVP